MPTQIIRPNTTLDASGWAVVGAATEHAATSDQSDASYVDINAGTVTSKFGFGTFTIPSGAVVSRWRFGARSRDGEPSGIVGKASMYRENLYSTTNWTQTNAVDNGGFVSQSGPWNTGALTQGEIDNFTVWAGAASGAADLAEVWVEIEYANKPSAPTVSAPTGTKTTDRNPAVTWTFNAGTDGGGQTKFQVKIFSDAQYGAGGFDPATSSATVSSGTVTSSSTTYSGYTNLPNSDTYRAYVRTAATTNGTDQWSDWAYSQFIISVTPSTPTSVTPSTTQTTNTPSLGASVALSPDSLSIRRVWEVASDSGFTTNKQTYSESTYATTKSGTVTFPGSWSNLSQGTWYVRCRAQDSDGVYGSYSATSTFTIAHVPSTSNRTPTGAISLQYTATPRVDWDFTDPWTGDVQSAYEAELWKLSAPGSPIQSTKTSSANQYHIFSGLDVSWKDTELRWRVRVYDVDDVVSAWSSEQAFYLRDLPTGNITAPVGAGGSTVKNPTVTWTFSASGGRTQASYHVVVTDTDVSQVVADSGVVSGAVTSWQMPSVINVGTNYSISLTVVDSTGLTGADTDTFTATYASTTAPTYIVDTSQYTAESYTLVDWSGATEDADCQYWRVYRRLQGDTTWQMIYQSADETPRSYYDYSCPANVAVEYAMTQTALQVGDPIESSYAIKAITSASLYSANYWLTCPENPDLNIKLYNVSSDDFDDEQEMSEVNLVNRGRQVSYGTRFGQRGTLTTQLWDRTEISAGAQRRKIEALRDSGLAIYLKSPFGDSWPVALPSAKVSRVSGVGLAEATTVTIDYVEVSA